jgi:uncharacterized protein
LVTPSNLSVQVDAERGPDHSIARLSAARTAFVGRTLRGPVDRPILIKSFSQFTQVFGGLWQPSSVGYAVEQFFDNGGREAFVVRVVNGARAATLTLKAGTQVLKLQALRPGTREFLRASVDYDNVAPEASAVFNLTIQRVRAQGTSQVEDQEIFPKVSLLPAGENYLPRVIAQSALVRLCGEMPTLRPDRTLDAASGLATAYATSNSDGDDGAPLTDYDLIGSSLDQTGLFALSSVDYFNFLCIPPLSRDQDVGPSALLVAARYCKERRALLIVDPPSSWHTVEDALLGLRHWNLADENAFMYFPRILAHDKLRGHFESFAPCGAVAGMLARYDEMFPLWGPAELEEAVLRPGYRPACLVGEARRVKLAAFGVNTVQAIRSTTRLAVRARTLAGGSAANSDWRYLAARRLALLIVNSIERGTRWVAEQGSQADRAQMVVAQVREFFEALHASGAFGTRPIEDCFFVICDARVNDRSAPGEFQFLIGFAALREHEFHSYRISHSVQGAKVSPVSLNRLNFSTFSPAELDWVDSMANRLQP